MNQLSKLLIVAPLITYEASIEVSQQLPILTCNRLGATLSLEIHWESWFWPPDIHKSNINSSIALLLVSINY